MPDVIVPVVWVKQEELYSCGPAVAQMVLSALGVPAPPSPPTWQQRLWMIVQSLTGEARPPGAGPGTPYAPSFPTQLCEKCPEAPYTCWATSPRAFERVMNAGQSTAVYSISLTANEESATTALLDTVDRGLPGIALVRGWQHWLVIDGYLHSAANASPVSGRNLNGIYVKNPQDGNLHYITWSAWKDDYLSVVPCGQYANTFVVIDSRRIPMATTAPSAPTEVRII